MARGEKGVVKIVQNRCWCGAIGYKLSYRLYHCSRVQDLKLISTKIAYRLWFSPHPGSSAHVAPPGYIFGSCKVCTCMMQPPNSRILGTHLLTNSSRMGNNITSVHSLCQEWWTPEAKFNFNAPAISVLGVNEAKQRSPRQFRCPFLVWMPWAKSIIFKGNYVKKSVDKPKKVAKSI